MFNLYGVKVRIRFGSDTLLTRSVLKLLYYMQGLQFV